MIEAERSVFVVAYQDQKAVWKLLKDKNQPHHIGQVVNIPWKLNPGDFPVGSTLELILKIPG